MILVDSEIRELIQENKLIKEGYNESNLNSMSYDLTIDKIIVENFEENSNSNSDLEFEEKDKFTLKPAQFIYIKSKELLYIPNNILGRVAEKNSLMRSGLVVTGPHYQPGHVTYSFLRVQNISSCEYVLKSGMKIAQIIFEQLSKIPEKPYDQDERASYNNEFTYKGFGKYDNQYNSAINKIENIKESLEEKENKIYSNIVTFMGIFISIFSIVTINFELFSQKTFTVNELTRNMVIINLSLGLVITFMMGLIAVIINKERKNKFSWVLGAIIILLLIFNIYFISAKSNNIDEFKAVQLVVEDSKFTVEKIQELLIDRGYDIEITGQLDEQTYESIDKFKKDNNIVTNSLLDIIVELNKL